MMNSKSKKIALAILTLVGLAQSGRAESNLQIPNPMVKPMAAKSGQQDNFPPMPGGAPAQQPQQQRMDQNLNAGLPGQASGVGGTLTGKSAFVEAKEKFANFYVSAIVGNQAVLRKYTQSSNPAANGQLQQNPMQPGMMYQTNIPGQTNMQQQSINLNSNHQESIIVVDNEPLDYLGDTVILTPKVVGSKVFIYYSEDGNAMKKGATRRQVVFLGQVESSMAQTAAPIVLQTKDQSYKAVLQLNQMVQQCRQMNHQRGVEIHLQTPVNPRAV